MQKQQLPEAWPLTEEHDITVLYLRLSRDDDKEGESNSIANQRALLKDYARKNHFQNVRIFIDDGVSGATFQRSGFQDMMALIEAGKVKTVIIKDMSRIGRNYIEVGQLMEIVFPQHNVRLIAINDGVDSAAGEDDFTPFRNIMNEWYLKDLSRKLRSAQRAKSAQGLAVGTCDNGEYAWNVSMLRQILQNRSYTGDVVNFRTYSKSYKLRERLPNSEENWEIHENVHEAIVQRSDWERVQRSFGNTKCRQPKNTEKQMLAGYLYCSDCGARLNYKYTHDNPANHYFSCRNNRENNGLCLTTHHVRVDKITELVTNYLRNLVCFACQHEDEFLNLVMDENYRQAQLRQKENQSELAKAKARHKELDLLYTKTYEDYALERLPEERFQQIAAKCDEEQAALRLRIRALEKVVQEEQQNKMNMDEFLSLVRRHVGFVELSPEILSEFIDKIIVHHRQKEQGVTTQKVEIYCRVIGNVDLPELDQVQVDQFFASFDKEAS